MIGHMILTFAAGYPDNATWLMRICVMVRIAKLVPLDENLLGEAGMAKRTTPIHLPPEEGTEELVREEQTVQTQEETVQTQEETIKSWIPYQPPNPWLTNIDEREEADNEDTSSYPSYDDVVADARVGDTVEEELSNWRLFSEQPAMSSVVTVAKDFRGDGVISPDPQEAPISRQTLPSRAMSMAMWGMGAQVALSVGVFVVAVFAPDALSEVTSFVGQLATTIAGVAGVGIGARAVVDHSSGGLTSSQGAVVASVKRAEPASRHREHR